MECSRTTGDDDDGGGGGGGKDNDHQRERANAGERASERRRSLRRSSAKNDCYVTRGLCLQLIPALLWCVQGWLEALLLTDDWPPLLLKDFDVHNLGRGERVIRYRSQVLMFCLHSAENGGGDLKGGRKGSA